METHQLCQPVKVDNGGHPKPATLPDRVAKMYLEMEGSWNLPKLVGISTSPLLSADGAIRVADGYDRATGLLCCRNPTLEIASRPSQRDAEKALQLLRQTFRTFPFADAPRQSDDALGVQVVDITEPPGQDESAFLLGILTAVCRASLPLAPGLLVTAPAISGAGSGKGYLVRATCLLAFGSHPYSFTTGGERKEFDKRLTAELVEGQPMIFLDNANGLVLESALLASVMTELLVKVRKLGQATMVPLNSTAFIAITGNGLTVAEDLARRFNVCRLDARCEDPEKRPFRPGFLDGIERRRAELLAAALTIWRHGRQNATALPRGKPLGSYETWAQWCRDPLLALGCSDPVERIEELKADDPNRRQIISLFQVWWEHHGSSPVKVNDLAEPVKAIANPQNRSRQWLATYIGSLNGTQAAGYVLSHQPAAGRWGASTYALARRSICGA